MPLNVASIVGGLVLKDGYSPVLDTAAAKAAQFQSKIESVGRTTSTSLGKASVDLDRFQKKWDADKIQAFSTKLSDAETRLLGVSRSLSTFGIGMSAAFTAPIALAGGAVINLGMQAVESENLVAVSFGNMRGAADAWSKDLSKNLGLNEFELRKQAGTLFNMTTAMGLSRDAAFDMSTGVAKLAADMASFRNIPMEEALNKIRSGLTGEAEPLKQIGILVNDNFVKTTAYAQGIIKLRGEMTESEKVTARWRAILAQTKNDQGDLARTLESPTNQLRIMKTQLTETATALGISLMPLVGQATTLIKGMVPYVQGAVEWFIKLPEPVKLGAVALTGLVAAAGPVALALAGVSAALSTVVGMMGAAGLAGNAGLATRALATLGNSIPILTARVWLLNTAGVAMFGTGGTLALGVAALAGIGFGVYKVIGAFQDLYRVWQQGDSILEHLMKRQETWLSRKFDWATGGRLGFAESGKGTTTWKRGGDVSLGEPQQVEAPLVAAGPSAKTLKALEAQAKKEAKIVSDAHTEIERREKQAFDTRMTLISSLNQIHDEAAARRDLRFRKEMQILDDATQHWLDYYQMQAQGLKDSSLQKTLSSLPGQVFEMQVPIPAETFWDKAFGGKNELAKGLSQSIMGAIQGGGNVMQSAGSFMANGLMQGLSAKLTEGAGAMFKGVFGQAVSTGLQALGAMAGPLLAKLSGADNAGLSALGMAGNWALAGAAFGPWGAAIGGAAGAVAGLVKGMNDGRAAIKDFASQFGGFDQLHAKLLEAGDAGEQMWVTLTQGTGRGDAASAQRNIEAANALLEQTAQKERQVLESANSMAEAQAAATSKVQDALGTLNTEYDSLFKSIQSEAPEKVMGTMEKQARARMAAVVQEKENLETKLLEMLNNISNAEIKPVEIPFYYKQQGGGPIATDERWIRDQQVGGGSKKVTVVMNGREVARGTLPWIADEMELQAV